MARNEAKINHAATPAKRGAGRRSKAPQPTQRRASSSRMVGGGAPRRTGGDASYPC